MLIHLTPSYFLKYANVTVSLIDVAVPELGVLLHEGADLTVRFPYPDKRLHHVCRRQGRRAIAGILLEADRALSAFTLVTRWAVLGEVAEHCVHFSVEGHGDAVTDDIMLWRGDCTSAFADRSPAGSRGWIPAQCLPQLSVTAADRPSARETAIWRRLDPAGVIRHQREVYTVPALERARLAGEHARALRLPPLTSAFPCAVRDCPDTLRVLHPGPGVCVCTLSEQLALLEEDLTREGRADAFREVIAPVLQDVRPHCPVFFTNTSDLMDRIRRFSPRYSALSAAGKAFVEYQINQPVFQVSDR